MFRFFIVISLLSLKGFCESELYSHNEELKEVLNNHPYEPNYFSMLLGLVFVILLIYLTGIIYQKLTKIKLTDDTPKKNKIEIISTVSIGQGKNLHIINAGGKNILIGSTQNSISYIKDIDDEKDKVKND